MKDNAAAWLLADRILAISYGYAVKMHESILAGKGAVGWADAEQTSKIVTVIGDAFDAAKDAAEVAYRRGYEEGLARQREGEESR